MYFSLIDNTKNTHCTMGCFILIHISKKHIREISFAGSITTSDPHNTTLGAEINLGKLRDMHTQKKMKLLI